MLLLAHFASLLIHAQQRRPRSQSPRAVLVHPHPQQPPAKEPSEVPSPKEICTRRYEPPMAFLRLRFANLVLFVRAPTPVTVNIPRQTSGCMPYLVFKLKKHLLNVSATLPVLLSFAASHSCCYCLFSLFSLWKPLRALLYNFCAFLFRLFLLPEALWQRDNVHHGEVYLLVRPQQEERRVQRSDTSSRSYWFCKAVHCARSPKCHRGCCRKLFFRFFFSLYCYIFWWARQRQHTSPPQLLVLWFLQSRSCIRFTKEIKDNTRRK